LANLDTTLPFLEDDVLQDPTPTFDFTFANRDYTFDPMVSLLLPEFVHGAVLYDFVKNKMLHRDSKDSTWYVVDKDYYFIHPGFLQRAELLRLPDRHGVLKPVRNFYINAAIA